MTVLAPKRPEETITYTLDLLRELQGDVIRTFTLTVTSGTVTLSGPGPTSDPVNAGVAIVVLIAGGVDAETATLALSVVTFLGQTIDKDYSLLVSDGVSAVYPSTASKLFICQRALEAMGLSPYEFDPTSEEYKQALDNLDMTMAELAVNGVNLGYAFPATLGGGNLDEVSGIPDFSVNFAGLLLGRRLAPIIGKTWSPTAQVALSKAEIAVRTKLATIPNYALPWKTPVGAGAKPLSSWYPWAGNWQGGNGLQGPSQ